MHLGWQIHIAGWGVMHAPGLAEPHGRVGCHACIWAGRATWQGGVSCMHLGWQSHMAGWGVMHEHKCECAGVHMCVSAGMLRVHCVVCACPRMPVT